MFCLVPTQNLCLNALNIAQSDVAYINGAFFFLNHAEISLACFWISVHWDLVFIVFKIESKTVMATDASPGLHGITVISFSKTAAMALTVIIVMPIYR